MIVVDSSALCAIIFDEPEKPSFQLILNNEDRRLLSAVNAHETYIVLRGKRGLGIASGLWGWLERNDFEIVPFDEAQARVATDAFNRYGKGIDPKARLNLADCAAYALSRTMNAPLLFKGEDFAATDVGRVA